MDSSGLKVIITAAMSADRSNGSVAVRHPSARIRQLLELTGLDRYIISSETPR